MNGTAKKELSHTGVKYTYCSILLHFSRSVDQLQSHVQHYVLQNVWTSEV
jgi:hypothetical protein